MSASSTMRKGFIFLLIIWNSSPFASGNTAKNHLQFLLGCKAAIPCQHDSSDSDSFKWFYKKDERSDTVQIFFRDKSGVELSHRPLFHPRMKVLRTRSLVIDRFTEDDQGDYWCEDCFQGNCRSVRPTVTSVKKEILKETHKTFYVAAGSDFTHACPRELTNLKWTFKASNTTAFRSSVQGPDFVTSNKSIQIVNIERAAAGKYTCWTNGCEGHWQKLLTINLCVITVHHSEDSSISCAVMCDMDFSNIKPNNTSNVEANTSVVSVLVDQFGSLHCSAEQMFDGHSTVNSTQGPPSALNTTAGIPAEPEYLIPVIYGTSAALTCLILMALLICYLRPRLRPAFPAHMCCCGLNGRVEEETSVVYSSVIIRRPDKTTDNYMTQNYCVYSEIKL